MTEPRASLEAAGVTIREAAAMMPVAVRTMEDWSRGVTQIPPDRLRHLRHLLGLERIPFSRARKSSI